MTQSLIDTITTVTTNKHFHHNRLYKIHKLTQTKTKFNLLELNFGNYGCKILIEL